MSFDIDELVNRFLGWKLPQDFAPDAGISFDREYGEKWGMPSGTNLFTATQARNMFTELLREFVPTGAFNSKYAIGEIVEMKQEGSSLIGRVVSVHFVEGGEPQYSVRRLDGALVGVNESELCIRSVDYED